MSRFVFVFLTFLNINSIAQNYIDSTARWTQSYSWTGFTASTHCNYEYYFDGDTIAENKLYLKMWQSSICNYTHIEYDSLGNPFPVDTTYNSISFTGFFREENKAFYFRINDTSETRLYNFNIHDTLSFDSITPYSTCYPSNVSVLNHDTVCIGSNARFRWRISMSTYPLAFYFIEGVGPSSGFKAPICRNGCPECGYGLTLFTMKNDTLYRGECSLVENGIAEQKTKNKLQIMIDSEYLKINTEALTRLSIYNSLGQLQTIYGKIVVPQLTINTSAFAKGFYIIKAESESNTMFERVYIR